MPMNIEERRTSGSEADALTVPDEAGESETSGNSDGVPPALLALLEALADIC
jgi:hypothetical protein